jgi:hypothetical protein
MTEFLNNTAASTPASGDDDRLLSSQLLDLEDELDTAAALAAALDLMLPAICDGENLRADDAVLTAQVRAIDAMKKRVTALRLGGAA